MTTMRNFFRIQIPKVTEAFKASKNYEMFVDHHRKISWLSALTWFAVSLIVGAAILFAIGYYNFLQQ